jgi:hypothetical protein
MNEKKPNPYGYTIQKRLGESGRNRKWNVHETSERRKKRKRRNKKMSLNKKFITFIYTPFAWFILSSTMLFCIYLTYFFIYDILLTKEW